MPLVTTVVVASLGIGIGVNASVFTWIQAMWLNPVPGVAQSGRLLLVEPRTQSGAYQGSSWREFGDLRAGLASFRELVAFRSVPFNVGDPVSAERTFGQLVSGNYFSGLGLQPAIGRLVTEQETRRPGAEPVVVIAHDYWQTHFAGDRDVVGRPLRVNGTSLTIVGVAPERFQGTIVGLNFDLWIPATMAPALLSGSRELEERGFRGYSIVGALAPGRSLADASGEVDAVMRQLADAHPDSNRGVGAEVLPFWWAPRGPQRMLLPALGILQGVMVLVLLAVCGNTANLMLARAGARRREMAVRLTLGARRWRIARLVLAENVLLGIGGGLTGLAVAMWGTSALRAMPLYGAFPIRFQTSVDAVTVLFALGLGAVAGVMFGLAPALQLARLDPQMALRAGSAIAGRSRLSRMLMAVEVLLALLVLMVGGLFLQKFNESQETDPHFRRDGLWLAAYDLSGRNLDGAGTRAFADRLLAAARSLPPVDAAAISSFVPLDIHGLPVRPFTLEGRARSDGRADEALTNTVTPGYLRAMGIALQSGRDFAELGDAAAPAQAIVNEEFVRRFLAGAEAVGRSLESRGRRHVIVGVCADSTYQAFGEPTEPIIYVSYRDRPLGAGEIHLSVRPGGEVGIGSQLQRAIRAVDPTLVLYNVRTMPEHIERNLFLRRIPARMFVVLGPLLLSLAALGIYAVVSYGVSQRAREIAVRLALGAGRARVVTGIVVDSLKLVLLGAAAAWLMAFDVYRRFTDGATLDPTVFVGVPLILIVVAGAAAWLPARRAGRIDAATALKEI